MKALLVLLAIRVPAVAASVTLGWDPNLDPVDHYTLKWGFASGLHDHPINTGLATIWTVDEPWPLGASIYFVATASNEFGESPPSNEVVWLVPIPRINLSRTSVAFKCIQGEVPTAVTITVTTSNGAAWSTMDTSTFYDTSPECRLGGIGCPSGASTTLTPEPGVASMSAGNYRSDLYFSAPGLSTRRIPVTLTITAPQ